MEAMNPARNQPLDFIEQERVNLCIDTLTENCQKVKNHPHQTERSRCIVFRTEMFIRGWQSCETKEQHLPFFVRFFGLLNRIEHIHTAQPRISPHRR